MQNLRLVLSCLVLAGCTQGALSTFQSVAKPNTPQLSMRSFARRPEAGVSKYKSLYAFKGGAGDGARPYAPLTSVGGALYGTTADGGDVNSGTIFTIGTSGNESLLHQFRLNDANDGKNPEAGLLNFNGTFYGTTYAGGTEHSGTVFSFGSGGEQVLYIFTPGGSGSYPEAGLIEVNGALYGTTYKGGNQTCNCGTVYKITTAGTETVLHSFTGGSDGSYPQARLLYVGGALYGATSTGGNQSCNCGTVFRVTTSGSESVLYAFKGSPDGGDPTAGLIDVNGSLYGTTNTGGQNNGGTAYRITTSGTEAVLYSFTGGSDGANPAAGLINIPGKGLYGTTQQGGGSGCAFKGCGTVFNVKLSGVETVLYSFQGGLDGATPLAGLTIVNGTLYGTTEQGGANGVGTVFSLSP
jgi:uncharacterized repeat protein (TIGR03803 family)